MRSPETDSGSSRRVLWIVVITLVVSITVGVLFVAALMAIAWPARWRTIRSTVHDCRWWLALAAVVAVTILVLLLLNKFLQRPWGCTVAGEHPRSRRRPPLRARRAAGRGHAGRAGFQGSVGNAVEHHLEVARKAAWPKDDKRLSVGAQFLDWWTGAPCEAAYVNVHEAEIALAQNLSDDPIQARIPEALARLQTMDVTDPRRLAAEAQLTSSLSEGQRRAAFQSATRMGMELKDLQHDRLRAFRNIVLATAAALALLVATVCLVGAWRPDALPLCFGPEPTTAGRRSRACARAQRGGLPVRGRTAVPWESGSPPPRPRRRRTGGAPRHARRRPVGRCLPPWPAGHLNTLRCPSRACPTQASLWRPLSVGRAAVHPW
jgi:hypothetical protein